MGFGLLFIGYFLVLNFAYPAFSDVIAAAVMLYAFYKLRGINRGFKAAFVMTGAFLLLGFFELITGALDMFFYVTLPDPALTAVASLRHLLVLAVTVTMLTGIKDVAHEVELFTLETKAKSATVAAVLVYTLLIFLEAAAPAFIPTNIMATLSVFALLASLALIAFDLTIIYGAYMRICMPDESLDYEPEESKFGFVNAFRRHQEERTREYVEYKLEKRKRKQEKKNKK